MKIYTKTGDDGTTGLLGKGRVRKDDPRIDAYGTVDELNAVLGVARACGVEPGCDAILARIQDDLFVLGSALADPAPDGPFFHSVTAAHVEWLEKQIDALEESLPALTQFILPGGTPAASHVHLARTVCRRAERLATALRFQDGQQLAENLLLYLNRLSDALFVVARAINHRANLPDVPWRGL